MIDVIKGIGGISVYRKSSLGKFLSNSGDKIEVLARLDFQVNSLISAA
jgi:hypothetical protein